MLACGRIYTSDFDGIETHGKVRRWVPDSSKAEDSGTEFDYLDVGPFVSAMFTLVVVSVFHDDFSDVHLKWTASSSSE
jgi:hypothetical protein